MDQPQVLTPIEIARFHVEESGAGRHAESFRYCSPDVAWSGFGMSGGLQEWKSGHMAFAEGFPDLQTKILRTVSQGDWVATWFAMAGTHTAAFMGRPATNKHVRCEMVVFDRIENGLCVEHHHLMDQWLMFQQMGLSVA